MKINLHKYLLTGCLATAFIFFHNEVRSQTGDSFRAINFPLLHEDFSLYDFAEVRMETGKTEKPPADIIKRNFQPVKEIFQKDSLYFGDSVQSAWFKFNIRNSDTSDASVALVFPGSVSKGVLYQQEGQKIILVGKTGWVIAVNARTISREWGRIDMLLKANSVTHYYLQIPRTGLISCPKTPALESIVTADAKAYNLIEKGRRPQFLWLHFLAGVFFMFFVFGFIKYLMLGKDRAYLYYSLLGLFSAFVTLAHSEYPPLELPWFENIRGIELIDLVIYVTFIMHGLFVLEILQLHIKYPRITRAIKWYFVVKFLLAAIDTKIQAVDHSNSIFAYIIAYDAFFFLLLMLVWVVYLATIRKGFYRFIFPGAVTIFVGYTLVFAIRFFNLFYLLPAGFGEDGRGNGQRIMQIALVIDMCFYFAGLAYRDRQVEKDKFLFQEKLKLQELESERAKAEFRQQAAELEMQALRAQMNPHFIFNSLNSINRFILQNNKVQASEYLTKFSRLVRMILQNSQESLITLENELETLKLYLDLEALRFENRFDFKISVPKDLDIDVLKVPPLIIQPYTENAIWHGLMHKENKGLLNIEVNQQNDQLFVKVTDDGVGRKQAAALSSKSATKHKSVGLKITAERIAMMQSEKGNESTVTINDLVNPDGSAAGTEVVIKMPVIL